MTATGPANTHMPPSTRLKRSQRRAQARHDIPRRMPDPARPRRPGYPTNRSKPTRLGFAPLVALLLTLMLPLTCAPANAQPNKPYDKDLMRLSEILGAIHYLRELCGAEDGQRWREEMSKLLQAEGSSALRRARLTRRFNRGYRSYSRTYNVCTASAKTAIKRFIQEGVSISEDLVERIP